MADPLKTIQELATENAALKKKIAELEAVELDRADAGVRLRKLEWMLSPEESPADGGEANDYDQGYGDLTELNRHGLILTSIGRERLESFANDYLELLGTSSAIYEADGNYALGIFSSGWCRAMDRASRELCNTPDNVEALNSRRWLCHESCWTDCSQKAIAQDAPVDIACNGGIRLYAVPIVASGNVVGAINFGYGTPPTEPELLRTLAERYHITYDELLRLANAYDVRPPFIIELAKKRLHATARLIGSIVETRQAHEALRDSEDRFRMAMELIPDIIIEVNADGTCLDVHTDREDLLILPKKALRGKAINDVLPKEIANTVMDSIGTALSSGSLQSMEYELSTPAGKHYFEARIVPSSGERAVALIREITDRKGLEEKLLEESERVTRQRNAIAMMALDDAVVAGDIGTALDVITKVLCETTEVARASVWLLSDDAVELRCRSLYEASLSRHTEGGVLSVATSPSYFESLRAESRIAAMHARSDHRTLELLEDHLAPLGITSLLDAAILMEGTLVGVVSLEHVGDPRNWHPDEESFISTAAALVGQVIADNKRKLIQKELETNYALLAIAGKTAKFGGWSVDLATNIITWSDEVARIHEMPPGYSPEVPEGIRFYAPEWRDRITRTYTDCAEKGISYDEEMEIITAKGKRIWVRTVGEATRDHEGNIVAVQGSFQDITERKRAEEALSKSEEKFRKVFLMTPDAININRLEDGVYVSVNPAFTRIMGYTEEEIIGKSSLEHDIWHDVEDRQKLVEGLKQDGQVLDLEATFQAKGGGIRYGLMSSFLIELNGSPHSINVTRDITERKEAEEEREKLQVQLQQARRLESVGTLAGGIAHDFNNLLMGILGNASLMMFDLDSSDPQYRQLQQIEEHVKSAADLTRQLLGFSQGGRYDVRPYSMNEIIKRSSDLFGRTKKEISIHKKFSSEPCVVDADRSQMEQVFMNLLVNAWQAMPGGGSIFIETERVVLEDTPFESVQPGQYVKINVTDTGTGMDEQTRERIFDPFFSTKGMGRGTGLGLATVYGIVKGHGGMIHVYSEPGHGTTFTLHLPLSEQQPSLVAERPSSILQGTETILLVDDEAMILNVASRMLTRLGYHVYEASSGQEAVALYREKNGEIDLVILDMIMPGISGSATFDQLREINPDVKVLLASGYSIEGQAREILDRGCDGFIQKPFKLELLSQRVREVLD